MIESENGDASSIVIPFESFDDIVQCLKNKCIILPSSNNSMGVIKKGFVLFFFCVNSKSLYGIFKLNEDSEYIKDENEQENKSSSNHEYCIKVFKFN